MLNGIPFTDQKLVHANRFAGFPFSFGVFQDYYSTHEPFAGSGHIPIIGTCAMVC
jgi:hypothetical protein